MKRFLSLFFAAATILVLATSCSGLFGGEEEEFDVVNLYGKWKSGTLYEKYELGGKGATWDTSDDVTEAEAQPFTWTLENATLIQIHIMQRTKAGTVPKTYTVKTLTETSLSYIDDYGKTKYFTKVD